MGDVVKFKPGRKKRGPLHPDCKVVLFPYGDEREKLARNKRRKYALATATDGEKLSWMLRFLERKYKGWPR